MCSKLLSIQVIGSLGWMIVNGVKYNIVEFWSNEELPSSAMAGKGSVLLAGSMLISTPESIEDSYKGSWVDRAQYFHSFKCTQPEYNSMR